MARGGKRSGTPGRSYSNRTDMHQGVKVAPGEPYGQRAALEAQQRAMPLPANQGVPAAASTPAAGMAGAGGATGPSAPAPIVALPGQQPFLRPTDRPDEPVTAGLPTGPGPGPEALGMGQPSVADPVLAQLTALYQASRDPDILKILELRQQNAQSG